MTKVADNPVRFRLRVTLKLVTLCAFAVCAMVAVQYLGSGHDDAERDAQRVAVDGIAPGEAHRVGWDRGAIWILHRSEDTRAELAASGAGDEPGRWLVVRDRGPRHGCSLVWERSARAFRETCSDARYDAAGRPVAGTDGPALETLPFAVDEAADALILG